MDLRVTLDISQMALAELLGVSFSSVNRWENGKYEPTKLAKKKIETFFAYRLTMSGGGGSV